MTLREHLEAIHDALSDSDEKCCVDSPMCSCAFEAVLDAREHAVAALAILEKSKRQYPHASIGEDGLRYRLVPDPEPSA